MATGNPRIQVMLDDETNALLSTLAGQQRRSISATAADLIREALELHEDILLSKHGDARFTSKKKWISHEDAWK
jgi:predicted transcriptional regulator